jgi:GNAT superfamily N-acetyltransferase
MNAHISQSPDNNRERVRHGTVSDAAEVARLLTQLGHATTTDGVQARWPEWAQEGNSALVIESESGSLLGICTLHSTRVLHRAKPVGRITALVVEEAERGKGIGRVLVAAAERELTNAGCGILEITSNARRTEAHAFYESLGYAKTSVRLFKNLELG